MNFQAPYLPWVLLGFSLMLGNSIIVDIMGIGVGHIYYFLEDVFPNQPQGSRLLRTPGILKTLLDGDQDAAYEPMPEAERPGGFNWGAAQQEEQQVQQERRQDDQPENVGEQND
eukprot:Seg1232.21 transcript_id=Seg1232.21/GoldUCD/mRNA.D3Y31 product=Derlin-2 protein_id=Seg1232.21/GoldUCD/D3Y31